MLNSFEFGKLISLYIKDVILSFIKFIGVFSQKSDGKLRELGIILIKNICSV